jgi:hypothetical protein
MQNLELKVPVEHKDATSFNVQIKNCKKVNSLLDSLVELDVNYEVNGAPQTTKNYVRFGELIKAGIIKGIKLDGKDVTNKLKAGEKVKQLKAKRNKKEAPAPKGETVIEPIKKTTEPAGQRGSRALN